MKLAKKNKFINRLLGLIRSKIEIKMTISKITDNELK